MPTAEEIAAERAKLEAEKAKNDAAKRDGGSLASADRPKRISSSMPKCFASYSEKDIENLELSDQNDKVASGDELAAILKAWEKLKISSSEALSVALDITALCYNNGSSDMQKLVGKVKGKEVYREEVVAVIRNHCTLRQFCAYFVNIVWKVAIKKDAPPANYAARGFSYTTRFAAFDFMHGVGHPNSIVCDGIPRLPSKEEWAANNAFRDIGTHKRAVKEGNAVLNRTEISGGKIGSVVKLGVRSDINCDI